MATKARQPHPFYFLQWQFPDCFRIWGAQSRLSGVRLGAGSGIFWLNLNLHLEVRFSHFPNLHPNLQVQVHKVRFRFEPRCTRFMSSLVQIWVCTKFTSGSGSDLGSGSQLYYNSRKMTYLIIIGVGMGMVKPTVSHTWVTWVQAQISVLLHVRNIPFLSIYPK